MMLPSQRARVTISLPLPLRPMKTASFRQPILAESNHLAHFQAFPAAGPPRSIHSKPLGVIRAYGCREQRSLKKEEAKYSLEDDAAGENGEKLPFVLTLLTVDSH